MKVYTTIAVTAEVLKLIEAIAKKRSEQLGFHVGKGDLVRNLVVHEARSLGLYPKEKGPDVARAPKRGKR